MLGKEIKSNYQRSENRGFNSALYFNAQNFKESKKLTIEIGGLKVEKRRNLGKETTTPKSIETPQSCTSGIDLKKCISRDLFNKIEESSPINSLALGEEIPELITPDDNFDESSDNIIFNLQPDLEEDGSAQQFTNYQNTQSYFNISNVNVNSNNNNGFNQYNSHPNLINFPIPNSMQMNPMFFFKTNNSTGNLLNNNNTNDEFSKMFKLNEFKKEELIKNTNNNTNNKDSTQASKNISNKTINNKDIKGWTCTQCKNFNYESNFIP
jgi:hypothetical protein